MLLLPPAPLLAEEEPLLPAAPFLLSLKRWSCPWKAPLLPDAAVLA